MFHTIPADPDAVQNSLMDGKPIQSGTSISVRALRRWRIRLVEMQEKDKKGAKSGVVIIVLSLIFKPSFELTLYSAAVSRQSRLRSPDFPSQSSWPEVFRISSCWLNMHTGRFVLKQALPQLRVQQEWFSDIRRIYTECAGLRVVAPSCRRAAFRKCCSRIAPTTCSRCRPRTRSGVVESRQLLRGDVTTRVARSACAVMLATMIRESWQFGGVGGRRFNDITIFDELRLDPYYERHGDACIRNCVRHFEELIASCRNRRVSLVHGDWSPRIFL